MSEYVRLRWKPLDLELHMLPCVKKESYAMTLSITRRRQPVTMITPPPTNTPSLLDHSLSVIYINKGNIDPALHDSFNTFQTTVRFYLLRNAMSYRGRHVWSKKISWRSSEVTYHGIKTWSLHLKKKYIYIYKMGFWHDVADSVFFFLLLLTL